MLFVVLATGPSLTADQVEHVRQAHVEGRCKAVAVSNAYQLAPWADALVSNDRNWWNVHPDAVNFAGKKFAGVAMHRIQELPASGGYVSGTNSGLQGMRVAQMLGATKILLLGFDMHGDHYFGKHPHPLRNTAPARFLSFIKQFDGWRGCAVVNCTPGSALQRFPMSTIEQELAVEVLCA